MFRHPHNCHWGCISMGTHIACIMEIHVGGLVRKVIFGHGATLNWPLSIDASQAAKMSTSLKFWIIQWSPFAFKNPIQIVDHLMAQL